MKKMTLALVGVLAAAMFPACTDLATHNGANAPQALTVPAVYQPEFKVDEKAVVQGEATVHALFGIFVWGAPNQAEFTELGPVSPMGFLPFPSASGKAKGGAVYNACKSSACDALVGTRYELTIFDCFVYKSVKASVTGYPAKMTGVKKVDAKTTMAR